MHFLNGVVGWLDILFSKDFSDELSTSKKSSVISHGSDETKMDEMTNVLVSTDLLFIVWNWCVLWIVLIDPLSPDLFISVNSIWELFEEECVFIGELVLRQGLKIEPCLLFHPVEWFVSVFDTSTALKE